MFAMQVRQLLMHLTISASLSRRAWLSPVSRLKATPDPCACTLQVRQLLLDPAVAREFERMSAQLQEKTREVRRLYEDTQAMNFSQEGKTGRLLMAKCRTLQVSDMI